MADEALPPVDVIVPFGDAPAQPERAANLHTVLTRYLDRIDYPSYRVVLVEVGPRATQADLAASKGWVHLYVESAAEFSPAFAQNYGFLNRPDPVELVYFHQADFVAEPAVLRRAVELMRRFDAPFVYPYWGEIHLSRLVSEAVRSGDVDGVGLYRLFSRVVSGVRADGSLVGPGEAAAHREVAVPPEVLELLHAELPAPLRRELAAADEAEVWGIDDRGYAPYRWTPSDQPSARICRISAGPRASAAYLCRDDAFRRIGGVPQMPGWGYEDLTAWLNVQSCWPYHADAIAVYFDGAPMSQDMPLVHLWHPVGQRAGYYRHTEENEKRYRELLAMTPSERRELMTPLPAHTADSEAGTAPDQRREGAVRYAVGDQVPPEPPDLDVSEEFPQQVHNDAAVRDGEDRSGRRRQPVEELEHPPPSLGR